MMALQDRVSMTVERADFDDLVTLVTQAPTWEKERLAGIRVLLRAIADGKPDAPDQILERWTWRLARATRKVQDRRASSEYPEAKRLLGALANSRGHRHEENAARLVRTAGEQPLQVGVALLASAEGYTPRANKLIDEAREQIASVQEMALALSENLPAPKAAPNKRRRRRRKKKGQPGEGATTPAEGGAATNGASAGGEGTDARPKRRRRRRKTTDGESGPAAPEAADGPQAAEATPAAKAAPEPAPAGEATETAPAPKRTRTRKPAEPSTAPPSTAPPSTAQPAAAAPANGDVPTEPKKPRRARAPKAVAAESAA